MTREKKNTSKNKHEHSIKSPLAVITIGLLPFIIHFRVNVWAKWRKTGNPCFQFLQEKEKCLHFHGTTMIRCKVRQITSKGPTITKPFCYSFYLSGNGLTNPFSRRSTIFHFFLFIFFTPAAVLFTKLLYFFTRGKFLLYKQFFSFLKN